MMTSQDCHPMIKTRSPEPGAERYQPGWQPTGCRRRARLRGLFETRGVLPARFEPAPGIGHAYGAGLLTPDYARHIQPIPRTDRVLRASFQHATPHASHRPTGGDPSPRKNFATTLDKTQAGSKITASWSITTTSLRRRVTRTAPSGVAVHLPGSFSRPRDYMPKRLRFFGVPRHLLFPDCVTNSLRVHEVVHAH